MWEKETLVKPRGVLHAITAAALFGLSTPAAKLLLGDFSPLMLSALLYLGATIALHMHRLGSHEAPLSRTDLPLLAGITFFGGILGPLLLLFGLKHLSAVTGSLLLNLEAPFTALIAIGLLREHLGKRETIAATSIMLGATLIGLQPAQIHGDPLGALEIAAACLCWGIDNNLTQRISLRDPVAVARIKTLAAGMCLMVLALWVGEDRVPRMTALISAGGVGALCYGISIVLDVKALRELGAARESAYFATAPFIGAIASMILFRELPSWLDVIGAIAMLAGVAVIIREQHGHSHAHEPILHEHLHLHDEHHQHPHDEIALSEPHSHPHKHFALRHDHTHVSDSHHRHSHISER
jgi:drug/metabolite transporter (DMT)-like permease